MRASWTVAVKVLIAIDHSIYSRAALDQILSSPWPPDTHFLVFTVAEFMHERTDYWSARSAQLLREAESKILAEHERLAQDSARELKEKFPQAVVEFKIEQGFVVDRLLEVADEWGADLIVVGSHGRRGLTRFLIGSVAESVASHARASVRVVRLPPGSS